MSLRPVALTAAAFIIVAWPVACGEGFEGAGPSSSSGSGAGGASSSGQGAGGVGGSASGTGGIAGAGGSSSSSSSSSGTGGGSPGPASCGAGSEVSNLSLFTTLDDDGSTLQPWLGDGSGAQYNSATGFVVTPDAFGLALQGAPERLTYRQRVNGYVNFDPGIGAIDFCYKPAYHHDDNADHMILWWQLGGPDHLVTVRKAGQSNNNEIHANIDSPTQGLRQVVVVPADYSLQPGQWVRFTLSWQLTGSNNNFFRLWLDGNELVTTVQPQPLAGVNVPGPADMALFGVGARTADSWGADGVVDELHLYDDPISP